MAQFAQTLHHKQEFAGLFPDEVTGIFRATRSFFLQLVALEPTQHLRENSTKGFLWGKGGRCHIHVPFENFGSLSFLEPSGLM